MNFIKGNGHMTADTEWRIAQDALGDKPKPMQISGVENGSTGSTGAICLECTTQLTGDAKGSRGTFPADGRHFICAPLTAVMGS